MAHPDATPTPPQRAGLGGLPLIIGALVMLLVGAVIAALLIANSDSSAGSAGSAQEALGYIPSDATVVDIRAQREAEQRLGIDDVETGADDAQIERYLTEAQDNPSIDNAYTSYLHIMNKEGGPAFTALDVDWSASVGGGSPASSWYLQLYGMDAGLDLDEVADDMVDAGWSASDVEGGRRLEVGTTDIDPQTGLAGGYPARTPELVLLPDEHLIVTGHYERVLNLIAGDSAPLQAADDLSQLIDADENPEYLHFTRGGQSCVDSYGYLMSGRRPSPDSVDFVDEIRRQSSGLAVPVATASLVLVDRARVTTTSRLLFDNEDEALDDKEARATYLRKGTSLVTREPIADLITVDSISVDGAVETLNYTLERGVSAMVPAINQRDFAPTFCLDL